MMIDHEIFFLWDVELYFESKALIPLLFSLWNSNPSRLKSRYTKENFDCTQIHTQFLPFDFPLENAEFFKENFIKKNYNNNQASVFYFHIDI